MIILVALKIHLKWEVYDILKGDGMLYLVSPVYCMP